ncbi:MAG: hypothetical protein ACMXX8_02735 [Candidatus Woesearchaeota archaeon]
MKNKLNNGDDLLTRFKLLSKIILPNSDNDITNLPVYDENWRYSKEWIESLKLSQEIASGYNCESKRGVYQGNTFLMFLATSLDKEILEDILNKGLSKTTEISDYVRKMKPLKGKNVIEIGGKRLSATAFGLGAEKAISLDGGDETGEGGPEERVNLNRYQRQISFKGDITFSQWALESGYGEVIWTRFPNYSTLNDAMFDILCVFSNITKEGGYSIHSYSNETMMNKFIKGGLSYLLDFFGFDVIHYHDYETDPKAKNVVFKKGKALDETQNWSFLLHGESKQGEPLACIIKKNNSGEIYEEKLDLPFKEVYFNITDINNMKAIPISLIDNSIINDFKNKQKQSDYWKNRNINDLIE